MAVAASGLAAASSRDTTSPPVVYAADVDSIIHPVSAAYMIETMDRADRAGVALVVFTLRTPGGLDRAMTAASLKLENCATEEV